MVLSPPKPCWWAGETGKTPPQAGGGAESGQGSPLPVGDWVQGGSIVSGWALVLAVTSGPGEAGEEKPLKSTPLPFFQAPSRGPSPL